MKKLLLLLFFGMVLLNLSKAQNPYESLGINDVKVLTLSNGKYNEFFNNDTLVRIGSVMLNTKTNKIVSFVDKDSIEQVTGFEPQLVSRWVSPDPLAEKYHEWSPYVYTYNNPILFIDPTGMEGIVVSGSPGNSEDDEGHENKQHFLVNGLYKAQAAQGRAAEGEGVTWIIYNDQTEGAGHDPKMLKEYTAKAEEAGITVKVVTSADEIVDYVNDKTGGDSRANDQVSSFYYVGHSTPGDLDVGYAGSGENFEPDDFNSEAFSSGAHVNLVGGCRTAVPGLFEDSNVTQFQEILDTKSNIYGSNVRVVYLGGVIKDETLVKSNNGQIIHKKGLLPVKK